MHDSCSVKKMIFIANAKSVDPCQTAKSAQAALDRNFFVIGVNLLDVKGTLFLMIRVHFGETISIMRQLAGESAL